MTEAKVDTHMLESAGRPDPALLGGHIRRGLAWKGVSQVTVQISRTAFTIVLARLLTPAEFGIAGMVLVFSGLILIMTDIGFSASIVQLPTLTEEDRSTAFWVGLLFSLACFGVSFAVAPYVADFYGEPRVRWMFVALAATFITGGVTTTQASLLWRRMDFRALELRQMLAVVISSVLGVVAAAAGLGAWSLIVQAVAMSAVSMVSIWLLSSWKPRLLVSVSSLRRMTSFSTKVFLSRFLTYGDRNADNLLIARFLGAHPLGIYSIGYSVIIVPFERLLGPLQNVITPAFAAIQDDAERLGRLWLRGTRLAATLIFPVTVGLILIAREAVPVLLGAKWHQAVAVVQILAWVALIQSLVFLNGAVFQSRFRGGLLLAVTAMSFAVDVASFGVGLHWGVKGVATAYAIANTAITVPASLLIVARLLKLPLIEFALELRGVVEATAAMALVVYGARVLAQSVDLNPIGTLFLLIFAGMASYLPMCYWRERRAFSEFRLRAATTASAA